MHTVKQAIIDYLSAETLEQQLLRQGFSLRSRAEECEQARQAYLVLKKSLKMSQRQNNELFATLKKFVVKNITIKYGD